MTRLLKTILRKTGDLLNHSVISRLDSLLSIEKEQMIHDLLRESKFQEPGRLERFGFRSYSQNDEDGIIQEIFNRIGVKNQTFIEFGVGNGLENNTSYLLLKNWKGLWIEGSPGSVKFIVNAFKKPIKTGQLKVKNSFITKDNINDLISSSFNGEIDLLSVDIDGNDYYVLEAINCVNPRVIIAEYNSKFPPPVEWIMEYDAQHIWDGSDKMGVSLNSLVKLANKKGYQLVGTNLNGVNAFFVRNDLVRKDGLDLFSLPATAEHLYNKPLYMLLQSSNGHFAKSFVR